MHPRQRGVEAGSLHHVVHDTPEEELLLELLLEAVGQPAVAITVPAHPASNPGLQPPRFLFPSAWTEITWLPGCIVPKLSWSVVKGKLEGPPIHPTKFDVTVAPPSTETCTLIEEQF